MKLGWGKCNIYRKNSVSGAPASGDWTKLPTPRENTTHVTTSQGTDLDAKIEGGETIDRLPGKNTYTLEWEEFVEKGQAPSFIDNDGIVPGNHALKVVPDADEACPGIQIDDSTIKAEIVYSTTDALRIKYSATALKPAAGNAVKLLNAGITEVTSVTVKDSDDATAETISDTAKSMAAGSVEVVFNGSNMTNASTAHLVVGGNIINLTRSAATSTAATFTGTSSAGALTAVVLDGVTILTLPAE